jgi:hypothetical protein
MKKNKIISDGQLRELFKKAPVENLPSGFMEDLMSKIKKEAVNEKKKARLIVFLQVVAGLAAMFLLPVLAIHLCNLFIPDFSFSFSDINIRFDSHYVVIGLAVLLLLIADSLYERHMANKQS